MLFRSKSEGNALWLDKEKTSSYELYQYIINFEDIMMEKYLKVYTFLTKEEIEKILEEHTKNPEVRIAQKTLAREVITYLHGESEYEQAVKISEALFNGNIKTLNAEQIEIAFKGVPSYEIDQDVLLLDLLVDSSICKSKREAREFIGNRSISVNGDVCDQMDAFIQRVNAIDNQYIVIRRGKKKYYIIKFV